MQQVSGTIVAARASWYRDDMANRNNHYEAAFEEFLRSRTVPYVAVDEARRSVLSDGASIPLVPRLRLGTPCREAPPR